MRDIGNKWTMHKNQFLPFLMPERPWSFPPDVHISNSSSLHFLSFLHWLLFNFPLTKLLPRICPRQILLSWLLQRSSSCPCGWILKLHLWVGRTNSCRHPLHTLYPPVNDITTLSVKLKTVITFSLVLALSQLPHPNVSSSPGSLWFSLSFSCSPYHLTETIIALKPSALFCLECGFLP